MPGAASGLSSLSLGPSSASDEPVSGMLWVHLLAGRGLRPSTGTSAATTPVTPSGGAPSITSTNGMCILKTLLTLWLQAVPRAVYVTCTAFSNATGCTKQGLWYVNRRVSALWGLLCLFCLGQDRRFGLRLGREFRTGSGQQQGVGLAYLLVGSSVQA